MSAAELYYMVQIAHLFLGDVVGADSCCWGNSASGRRPATGLADGFGSGLLTGGFDSGFWISSCSVVSLTSTMSGKSGDWYT
jgi:hypothetical protein